jgi:glyoxylase I family protein
MTQQRPIAVQNFSHVCIGVSDIEASLAFYTAVLGMDVVFDIELAGAGLDSVTGGAAQQGRMVGGLIGAAMVELLSLGAVPECPSGPHLGYTNISFRVDDLDAAYETVAREHPAVRAEPPVDIGGCGCSSSTTPMGRRSSCSNCPAARRARCSSGVPGHEPGRPAKSRDMFRAPVLGRRLTKAAVMWRRGGWK